MPRKFRPIEIAFESVTFNLVAEYLNWELKTVQPKNCCIHRMRYADKKWKGDRECKSSFRSLIRMPSDYHNDDTGNHHSLHPIKSWLKNELSFHKVKLSDHLQNPMVFGFVIFRFIGRLMRSNSSRVLRLMKSKFSVSFFYFSVQQMKN